MTKKIRLNLSVEELKVLVTLAENEFFRMRFINPRLPGYTIEPEIFRASQSATALLTEAMKKERGFLTLVKVATSNN
jgi:hypothetical protein